MDTPLDYLMKRISTFDFEEYEGSIGIDTVAWDRNDLTLGISISEQEKDEEKWVVRCHEVRESRFDYNSGISGLTLATNHPLLMPHTGMMAELFFNGISTDIDRTVGMMFDAHCETFGRWVDFLRFFNLGTARSLRTILRGKFGLLAKGPLTLLERYSGILSSDSVAPSLLPPTTAKWWNGEAWIENESLSVLVFEKSFVISPSFEANRL